MKLRDMYRTDWTRIKSANISPANLPSTAAPPAKA